MLKIDLLQAAAKIIRAHGVDGLEIAIKVVGSDVALGMLVLHLRATYNSGGVLPEKPDTDEKVIEILTRLQIERGAPIAPALDPEVTSHLLDLLHRPRP